MRKSLYLSTFVLALSLSSCVTLPNTEVCTVAGLFTAGAICAETLTPKTRDMPFEMLIEYLEPQTERPDPEHPGQTLPARGGAICQTAEDYGKIKTVLEQACRELGSKCSYELKGFLNAPR